MSRPEVNRYSTAAELTEYCANPPPECVLCVSPYGNKVVRISSQAVIRFGIGVTETEAINQSKAYVLVDPHIVSIPKIHRNFTDNERHGYIVMDFVDGEAVDPLEDP